MAPSKKWQKLKILVTNGAKVATENQKFITGIVEHFLNYNKLCNLTTL